jgi:hypothetical protein
MSTPVSNSSSYFANTWRALTNYRAWHPTTTGMLAAVGLFLLEVVIFSIVHVETRVLAYAFSVPAITFASIFLRRLNFHWSTIATMLGVLFMYGTYLGYTSHNERNFDVKAQVTYIEYIVDNLRAPPDNHCFICHHPPLYYSVSALVYGVTKWLDVAPPLRGVQMISLIAVFSFVLCTALITRRFTSRPWAVTLAAALCGFWPYTIIFSARVHNDVLATALMAWTIYFCVRWYQDEDRQSLRGALIFGVLSVLTKMNGLEMIALCFATVGYKALSKPNKLAYLRPFLAPFLVTSLGLASFIATRGSATEVKEDKKEAKKDDGKNAEKNEENKDDGDKDSAKKGEGEEGEERAPVAGERLFGSAFGIGERAWMGNEPYNYFYFDLENFLREPFVLARKEGTGRQYFLNHWLKSSLFSTHNERPDSETSYRFNHRVAQIENFLLLCLIAYFLGYIVQAKKADFKRHFVLNAAFAGLFLGAAAFRVVVPHAHHSDFRHAFTIMMPFCIAYALATVHYRKRDSVMEYVGYILAALFLSLSIFYFAPKYGLIQKVSPTEWIEKKESEISARVKAGTKWDDPKHILLEGTDGLKVKLTRPTTVERVELSADHNDKYQITIIGESQRRTIEVGPHPDNKAGMADYNEVIDPPIEKVKEVVVRPISGDRAYSIGHVIINGGPSSASSSTPNASVK